MGVTPKGGKYNNIDPKLGDLFMIRLKYIYMYIWRTEPKSVAIGSDKL